MPQKSGRYKDAKELVYGYSETNLLVKQNVWNTIHLICHIRTLESHTTLKEWQCLVLYLLKSFVGIKYLNSCIILNGI